MSRVLPISLPEKFDPAVGARATGPFSTETSYPYSVGPVTDEDDAVIDAEFEVHPSTTTVRQLGGSTQTTADNKRSATAQPQATSGSGTTPPGSPPAEDQSRSFPPKPTAEQKDDRKRIRNAPVNRTLTFMAGIFATIAVWFLVLMVFYLKWGIKFTPLPMNLIFVVMIYLIFCQGIRKNATKEGETAGYVGVIYLFGSPISAWWLQIVVPSGWIWLPPLICRVVPVFVGEVAINIPPLQMDQPFDVPSISEVNFAGEKLDNDSNKKFVLMAVRTQIRKRIIEPYRWINQKPSTIEKTQVNLVVEKIRGLSTNGVYRDVNKREVFTVSDDYDLMRKKAELGEALTDDVRGLSEKAYGEEIIGVIVPHLEPRDEKLVKQYERVAIELAQRTAETIEMKNFITQANMIVNDASNPINSFERALTFVLANAGKITYDQFVIKGSGGTVVPVVPGATPHGKQPKSK